MNYEGFPRFCMEVLPEGASRRQLGHSHISRAKGTDPGRLGRKVFTIGPLVASGCPTLWRARGDAEVGVTGTIGITCGESSVTGLVVD